MSDVVTGEAVALDVPVANFPGRVLALALDLAVQLILLLAIGLAIVMSLGQTNGDYLAAVWIGGYVLIIVGYPTVFETLTRGKTLGKMALGLRVVGDDGSPERFRQALVRSLVGLVEIYTIVLAPVALITSIVSARGKRVGDIFAGTYVLQERMPYRAPLPPVFAVVPPPLAGWAQSLQLSRLSDQTADAAGSYLRRYGELAPRARESVGIQLANAVAAQVSPPPPPGTPAAAYLSAVLAVRRDRDPARAWFPAGTVPPLRQASPPPPPDRAQPGPSQPGGQPAPEPGAVPPAQPARDEPADPSPPQQPPGFAPPA
jgi:uncharacterized RDD family membrane protein YckC